MTSKIEDRVTSIIEEEVRRSIYEAPRLHDYGFDLGVVARSIALRSAAKIVVTMGLTRTIDRDRIKQGVLKLVNACVRNQWLCVEALELAVVDHVIDEIERVDHVIDEIEGKASVLVTIDREKIKRWVILHHPIFEWSSLSDSTLSSVIDFAIDKIEEGPVEVAEVSKLNDNKCGTFDANPEGTSR